LLSFSLGVAEARGDNGKSAPPPRRAAPFRSDGMKRRRTDGEIPIVPFLDAGSNRRLVRCT
jgi:hypothetical protein